MISLVRKPIATLALRTLACSSHICSSDSVQNKNNVMKSDNRIRKLSTKIVRHEKSKKTSRSLSTIQNEPLPTTASDTAPKDERQSFMSVFPDFVNDLTEAVKENKCNEAAEWFAEVLNYNLPLGKKSRGIQTVITYRNLVKKDELTPEKIKLSQYLGWCVEMFQSFFLISDDIMDNSTTRRGQLCWHRMEKGKLTAANDCLMVENAMYAILKKHFRKMDCYVDLIELFHEISFITTCGQSLDLLNSNKSVESFKMDTHKSIADNKTSYYTFYLPVALAMHLAGIKDPEVFRQSKTILLEMGHFYQVQDDFLDCFGNPEVTGKIGTDIQGNKCSWLAVLCMQRANESQKAVMSENYGKNDPIKVERVKELYKELGLPNIYATYEEESSNMIKTHIQQTSCGIPHEVFLGILDKIYQRNS